VDRRYGGRGAAASSLSGDAGRLAGEETRAHRVRRSSRTELEEDAMRGAGRVVFAGALLLIAGTLNVIYGIGALDNANIFVNDQRFIFTNLNTMGWVLIVLGVIQLLGGFSLFAGRTFGRVLGIIGGSLGAIGALLSIGGSYPWWSLGIFALCVYIVHGIAIFDGDEPAPRV
jgi:hypothetical protein